MDPKSFGAFIADCRREQGMTQAELARRLNVTDKAVSRWERGVGFPDILSLESLADALGISVLELMRSERNEAQEETRKAEEAVRDTLTLADLQRRQERRHALTLLGVTALAVGLLLCLDMARERWDVLLMQVVLVFLPLCCAGGFLVLLGCGLRRKVTGMPYKRTLALAVCLLAPLTLILGFFFLCGLLGLGPVPT